MAEPRLLEQLNLVPFRYEEFLSVDGVVSERPVCKATVAMVDIPLSDGAEENFITLHEVDIAILEQDGQLGNDIDALIGMDIISRGDFAVSRDELGNYWCSFRHPSAGSRIDFNET